MSARHVARPNQARRGVPDESDRRTTNPIEATQKRHWLLGNEEIGVEPRTWDYETKPTAEATAAPPGRDFSRELRWRASEAQVRRCADVRTGAHQRNVKNHFAIATGLVS